MEVVLKLFTYCNHNVYNGMKIKKKNEQNFYQTGEAQTDVLALHLTICLQVISFLLK